MAGRSPGHQRPPGVSPPLLLPLPGFASGYDGARTVMDGALEPASCQGAWARLSEERTRGRMPGMSSTMCFWGAEEQAELSLEKKDLCCLFLNPGVKCLKIIISRRRGFKNMTRGGGRKKNPD